MRAEQFESGCGSSLKCRCRARGKSQVTGGSRPPMLPGHRRGEWVLIINDRGVSGERDGPANSARPHFPPSHLVQSS